MSAVVGFLGLDGRPAKEEDLQHMVDRLAHRGPDGRAIWVRGSVGLGHCMLQTTPESLNEHLPLEREGLVITADARIDNRDELLASLGFSRYTKGQISDSELILAAYEKWGMLCPQKLLGDFVFSIWDEREQILFCARDCFGVKPFYYYHSSGQFFVFASEIKALNCIPQVPFAINEVRIGDYLAIMPGDKVSTFYQDIHRLPPAHSLLVNPIGARLQEYWTLEPTYELRLGTKNEYAEAYLDVFTQAIQCRLRSPFAIGSALSGGLDSSSIVCIAREHIKRMNKQPLTTFSGVFDEVTESDERPYINSVIEQGGIKSHFVHPDRMSPLVELEQVLWHQEEPLWTPNLFMHWGLYSSAQQQGIRVFLDGFLGDNVVCHGWEHLMDLAYAWRWFSLFREIRGVARRQAGYSSHQMVRRYLWECSIKPWIPNQLRRAWRMIRLFRNPSSSKVHLGFKFNPDFARRIHLARRRRALQPSPVNPPGAAKQRHHQDLTAGEIPLGLEISNKISKAFSLEVWYPFTDRRLAELCLATPSHQRIQDGWSRMIVRRALANHLPAKVCWRSDKGDLSHNLVRGLLRFEEQRMDEVILNNAQVIEPYIDTTELRKSYMHYKQKGTSDDIQAIWSAVNLATWLRHTNANLACDYSNKFQKA